jgi:hypothetical protein
MITGRVELRRRQPYWTGLKPMAGIGAHRLRHVGAHLGFNRTAVPRAQEWRGGKPQMGRP